MAFGDYRLGLGMSYINTIFYVQYSLNNQTVYGQMNIALKLCWGVYDVNYADCHAECDYLGSECASCPAMTGQEGVTILTLTSRQQTSVTVGARAGASPPMAQTLSPKTVFVLQSHPVSVK